MNCISMWNNGLHFSAWNRRRGVNVLHVAKFCLWIPSSHKKFKPISSNESDSTRPELLCQFDFHIPVFCTPCTCKIKRKKESKKKNGQKRKKRKEKNNKKTKKNLKKRSRATYFWSLQIFFGKKFFLRFCFVLVGL